MSKVGLDDPGDYRLDILRPGPGLTDAKAAHLRAFEVAIRKKSSGVTVPELLAAGQLPPEEGSITDFKGVHDRGLAEVANFLGVAK